jgi:hypothetical protein
MRNDALDRIQSQRRALTDEVERNREKVSRSFVPATREALERQRLRGAETLVDREQRNRELVAARQAASHDRAARDRGLVDLKGQCELVAGQGEQARYRAIVKLDAEAAIAAQVRIEAARSVQKAIDEVRSRP